MNRAKKLVEITKEKASRRFTSTYGISQEEANRNWELRWKWGLLWGTVQTFAALILCLRVLNSEGSRPLPRSSFSEHGPFSYGFLKASMNIEEQHEFLTERCYQLLNHSETSWSRLMIKANVCAWCWLKHFKHIYTFNSLNLRKNNIIVLVLLMNKLHQRCYISNGDLATRLYS